MKNPWLPKRLALPPSFFLSRWLFLRLLGTVYLAAFLSLGVQIHGLIGSHGILPGADYLRAIQQEIGEERYYLFPTLCGLDSGDWFLTALCVGGAILSALLILGLAPVLILVLLWAFHAIKDLVPIPGPGLAEGAADVAGSEDADFHGPDSSRLAKTKGGERA